MAQIINSWSLLTFAKNHGKMQLGTFKNANGEAFKSCIFSKGDDKCFVGFSSKMGELSAQEIVAQKEQLNVVELDSHNFYLCRNNSSWEDVDL